MMTDTSDGELKLKKMESTLSTRTHSQIKSFGRKSGRRAENGTKVDVRKEKFGREN